MKKENKNNIGRRHFITRSVPACALSVCALNCVAKVNASGLIQQQDQHKFDHVREFEHPLTLREDHRRRNSKFIRFCRSLIDELGEEKAMELFKNYSTKSAYSIGQYRASKDVNNEFVNCMKLFKNPAMQSTLTMEVVEDSDTVFEVKITECLSYDTFKAYKFDGKFGYALVCHGDYGYVDGYNSKIKLKRDKTLMEGHAYCNHRYFLEND